MTHVLKVWPTYFSGLVDRTKTFELRKNDRGFREGDFLTLKEWEPGAEQYTGREVSAQVTCMVDTVEEWGLMDGFCILGIEILSVHA